MAQTEQEKRNPRINKVDFDFTNHKPTDEGVKLIEQNRSVFKALSRHLINTVPEGREQSLALTNLEQALFWANAAVARVHTDDEKPE